jgi:hypothetical protein
VFDDAPPAVVSLPLYRGETDRRWQEDVLRNAALTDSLHTLDRPGRHTLRICMIDPGLVIDTIIAENGATVGTGYLGPAETRRGW